MNTQYISLNMVPSGVVPVLHVSQYDVGRPLGVVVYNGGTEFDLDDYTVTVESTRTDETPITAAVTTDGNVGAFVTTATMTNKEDIYPAQLVVVDGSSNRVASLPFMMHVVKAAMDENSEAVEEDASLYQQYNSTVQALIATIRTALNTEVAARQTADNTLQNNINTEAITRATADTLLGTRIDQIIAPSGQAPSAAEVTDARIGTNGTVYSTLGGAIRGQISDLESNISADTSAIYGYTRLLPVLFMKGNITGGGAFSDITYRVRGIKPFTFSGNITYTIADGYRVRIFFYDKTTLEFLSASEWKTGSVSFSNAYAQNIVIARIEADEDTTEIADIEVFSSAVYLKLANPIDDLIRQGAGSYIDLAKGYYHYISDTGKINPVRSASEIIRSAMVECTPGDTFYVNYIGGGSASPGWAFADDELNALSVCPTAYTALDTVLVAPANAKYAFFNANITDDITPYTVTRGVPLDYTIGGIKDEINILQSMFHNEAIVNWMMLGSPSHRSGWTRGERTTAGGITNSDYYIRTVTPKYSPEDDVLSFTVKAPDGYAVAVSVYGSEGQFIERIGEPNSTLDTATQEITITPREGYSYAFCVGYFSNADGQAKADDVEFVKTIVLTEYSVRVTKHLNILVLGNSYSSDSWQYVPFILLNYGITVNLYMYYRGSGSIYRMYEEWEDNSDTGLDEWGRSHIRRMFHIDTRYTTRWDNGVTGYSPKMMVEIANDENSGIDQWDIISLQTGGRSQYLAEGPANPADPRKGPEPYTRWVIDLINESYTRPYHLAWFGIYTGFTETDVSGYPIITRTESDNRVDTLRALESICHQEPFDMVISAAAAVFNARTNSDLASTEISSIGNLWYADYLHLQSGIPCYVANATVVQSIFNKFFPGMSVLNDPTPQEITDDFITEHNLPTPSIHGSVMSTDPYLYTLAQRCAVIACNYPFDMTAIYSEGEATPMQFLDELPRYWADALIDTSDIPV